MIPKSTAFSIFKYFVSQKNDITDHFEIQNKQKTMKCTQINKAAPKGSLSLGISTRFIGVIISYRHV